jgi:hypothetical protein
MGPVGRRPRLPEEKIRTGSTIGSVTLKGKFTEGKTTTFSGSSMSLSGLAVTVVLGR